MNHNIVDIGQVITNGVVFDPKNSHRLEKMNSKDLLESIVRLFQLLDERQVKYVIVGGIAMLVYVDGRNTQDIDLIVSRESLEKIPELQIVELNGAFGRAKMDELQIDLLFTDQKLFQLVRDEYAEKRRFVGHDIQCATAQGMLLLKLFALPSLYRQGEFAKVRIYENDIAGLIECSNPKLPQLIETLESHLLGSDVAELKSIVADIQTRIQTARNRFGNTEKN